MVKTKMNYKGLMKQDHYTSILNLTKHFQGEIGLQHKHYSFALQKKSSEKEKKQHETGSIVGVFGIKGEKLKPLYESGEIIKDCIKPGTTTLSNFLTKLVDYYGYLEIANEGEKNHRRYKTSVKALNRVAREHIKTEIDEYPLDYIRSLGNDDTNNIIIDAPYRSYFQGGIFGLPTKYDQYMQEDDCKEIQQSIINIYKELNKINNIKLKYMEGASHFSFYGKVVIDPKIKEYMDAVEETVKKMKKFKNGFRG